MKKFTPVLVFVVILAMMLGACQPAATPAAPAATQAPAVTEAAPAVTQAAPAATAAAVATTEAAPAATEGAVATTEAAAAATTEAAPAAGAGGQFRVAVVMPSAKNDLAFSQSMYDALTRVKQEMGADKFDFAYSENMFVVDDAAAAIRDYASKGYNLVIAHGSQYGTSLAEIAPDFPKTSFAWGTTVDTFTEKGIKNIFAYEARAEEGGYVNGVMAALLSKSGVIGVIGPIETGDAKLYVDGFKAGVMATKPNAQIKVTWTQDFSDVAKASAAAQTQINAGADVLTGTAQMVTGAIGVAKTKGVYWFGTQSDQASLAPNIVVASQVYKWDGVLKQMISLIQGGTLGGQAFAIALQNGGEVIQINPDSKISTDIANAAQTTIQGISNGTIKIQLPSQ